MHAPKPGFTVKEKLDRNHHTSLIGIIICLILLYIFFIFDYICLFFYIFFLHLFDHMGWLPLLHDLEKQSMCIQTLPGLSLQQLLQPPNYEKMRLKMVPHSHWDLLLTNEPIKLLQQKSLAESIPLAVSLSKWSTLPHSRLKSTPV